MTALPPFVPVDHVIDGIHISGWRAVLHARYLRDAGVSHVLKLYPDIPFFPSDFDTLNNPLDDGVFIPWSVLRRGVDFVLEQVEAGRPVLVMCAAGISRSSTFVLAAMLERGHDLRDAYRLLRRQHPPAAPLRAMWDSLITHYNLEYGVDEAYRWTVE